MQLDHLSYSSINTYLLCPRSWKYRYVDKIKTPVSTNLIFGSAMHDAVEEYIRMGQATADPFPVSEHFDTAWRKQFEYRPDVDWQGESEDSLTKLATSMTTKKIIVTGGGPERDYRNMSVFLNDFEPLVIDDEPVIEKRVSLSIPGLPIPLIGYVDLLTSDGVPCDFKTASPKSRWSAEKAKSELQPLIYLASLAQEGYALNPDLRFRYIILRKMKTTPKAQVIEIKQTWAAIFERMRMIVEDVWPAIEAGAFPPNESSWKHNSKYCDYWDLCPYGGG
jgi:hypothetical protein